MYPTCPNESQEISPMMPTTIPKVKITKSQKFRKHKITEWIKIQKSRNPKKTKSQQPESQKSKSQIPKSRKIRNSENTKYRMD